MIPEMNTPKVRKTRRRVVWTIDDDSEDNEPIEEVEEELKTYDDKPIFLRQESIDQMQNNIDDSVFDYYCNFSWNQYFNGINIVRIIPLWNSGTLRLYIIITKNDGIYDANDCIGTQPGYNHYNCGLTSSDVILDGECLVQSEESVVVYISVKNKGVYAALRSDFNTWYEIDGVFKNSVFSCYCYRVYDNYTIYCCGNRDNEAYTGEDLTGVYVKSKVSVVKNESLPTDIVGTCLWYDSYSGYYLVGFAANESGQGGVWYTTDPLGTWTQATGDLRTVEITSIVCYNGVVKVGGSGIWETNDITQGFTKNTDVPDDTGYYIEYDSTRSSWWAVPSVTGHYTYLTLNNGQSWGKVKTLKTNLAYTNICVYGQTVRLGTSGAGMYVTDDIKDALPTTEVESTESDLVVYRKDALNNIEGEIKALETKLNISTTETSTTTAPPILIRDDKIQNLRQRISKIQDSLPS